MGKQITDPLESDDLRHAVSTSHLLHRAQQLASDRFAFLVGEDGLTLRQFVVMAAIAEQPGLNQAELARATGIDRSTLADMMPRLEKRAHITRRASEADARANIVRLTECGLAALAGARQHAKAADAAILDALPRTKRKTFIALLDRLAEHADKLARRAERDEKRRARRAAKENARRRRKSRAEVAADPKPRRKPKGR
jgi:DNA-binding MarR family transcriptional regulator